MSSVDGLRAGFSALQQPIAFFDGPGGTQVPDAVIDAMASYLRESNANSGGAFATSRATDALIASARATAARFLGGSVDEVVFGASMTDAQLRTLARGRAGLGRRGRDRLHAARPRCERRTVARARARPRARRALRRR